MLRLPLAFALAAAIVCSEDKNETKPKPAWPSTGLTIDFTYSGSSWPSSSSSERHRDQLGGESGGNGTLIFNPSDQTFTLCPISLSVHDWQPSLPSFVDEPKAKFTEDVTVDGVVVDKFSYRYSSNIFHGSYWYHFQVTPAGVPVLYTYSEHTPMDANSMNISFQFQTAKMAPSSC